MVVTSGYDTGVDDGVIWILNPADGSIIHSITVPRSGDLGPPLVVDLNSDRVADRIYVGDTDGNLWRFDLPDGNEKLGLVHKKFRSFDKLFEAGIIPTVKESIILIFYN